MPSLFDSVADALEQSTSLDRLEARGTLRLVLKEAGLEARDVDASSICVAIRKLLPKELESRGIDEAERVCENLAKTAEGLGDADVGSAGDSPEDVFRRLGG